MVEIPVSRLKSAQGRASEGERAGIESRCAARVRAVFFFPALLQRVGLYKGLAVGEAARAASGLPYGLLHRLSRVAHTCARDLSSNYRFRSTL